MKKQRSTKSLLLVAVVLVVILGSVAAGIVYSELKPSHHPDPCDSTRFPDECRYAISAFPSFGPYKLLTSSASAALLHISQILDLSRTDYGTKNASVEAIYRDCSWLLDRSIQELNSSIPEISKLSIRVPDKHKLQDIQTWMSASMTFYTNCFDGLEVVSLGNKQQIVQKGLTARKQLSNALWILNALYYLLVPVPHERRLFTEGFGVGRRLFEADSYDAIVAKDGSGNFTSIQDAVDAAPVRSAKRHVIYIRAGNYSAPVYVKRNKINLMFIGDGIGNTIITANNSVKNPGVTTISSAIVAIDAAGFIARDLTIQNTAGPQGAQAVALRMSADHAAFLRCSIEGYQDSLLAHSHRQFYKDCTIRGTVDFVFGNAAAVFQGCNISSLIPLPGQVDVIAAQGRNDQSQSTGFVFQECTIDGDSELFLGRPWMAYSRTLYLSSELSDKVNPQGWLRWQNSDENLNTLFFGEYKNSGPGAAGSSRVPWATQINDSSIAQAYAANNFISADTWLSTTGIDYQSGT